MIEICQTGLLASLQGCTELLMVLGSARPLIPTVLPGWSGQGLAFDVVVHGGAPGAVVLHYRADVLRLAHRWSRSPGREPACAESRHCLDGLT